MKLERLMAIALTGCLAGTPLHAAVPTSSDLDAVLSDIRTDSALISQWMSDQIRVAVPYNANVGGVVPSQIKMLGFEFGVSGVVSGTKIDVDGLRALNTSVIDANSIDTSSKMPFPAVLAHAKIGLPFGLDAGVRFGGIPEKSHSDKDSTVKVKNKIAGLDVRKAIIKEGIGIPGVTLGLSYTHTDGEVDWTSTNVAYNGQVTSGGNVFNTSSNAQTATASKWKTDSVGLEALLHKKVLMFTPYVGARVNHNSGNIDTSITTTGSVTITDPNSTSSLTQSNVSETGSGSRAAEKWNTHLMLGTEITIFPFVRLGIHGDYAGNQKVAGALDLRFQFH